MSIKSKDREAACRLYKAVSVPKNRRDFLTLHHQRYSRYDGKPTFDQYGPYLYCGINYYNSQGKSLDKDYAAKANRRLTRQFLLNQDFDKIPASHLRVRDLNKYDWS